MKKKMNRTGCCCDICIISGCLPECFSGRDDRCTTEIPQWPNEIHRRLRRGEIRHFLRLRNHRCRPRRPRLREIHRCTKSRTQCGHRGEEASDRTL